MVSEQQKSPEEDKLMFILFPLEQIRNLSKVACSSTHFYYLMPTRGLEDLLRIQLSTTKVELPIICSLHLLILLGMGMTSFQLIQSHLDPKELIRKTNKCLKVPLSKGLSLTLIESRIS
jgi:hypothetical protein